MLVRHWVFPILSFAAITTWWLFPVLSNLSAVIPGAGAGDNVTFVWNVWWMQYVLHHSGETFFFTPLLFYPAGADLTLHTHTALPAIIGALAATSPIAGQNFLIVLHIFLNFVCMYALAHRVSGHAISSFAAAVIFGTSPFVGAHLLGHFNLIAAWTMPLVCLLTLNALDRPVLIRTVLVGVALAATAYTDYYLFVYANAIVVLFWLSQAIRIDRKAALHASFAPRRLFVGLLSVLTLDLLVIAAILLFPGHRFAAGPIHMSMQSPRNPITIGWILLLIIAAIFAVQMFRVHLNADALKRRLGVLIGVCATTVVLLMPLLVHAARLWRTGNYVSQAYFWRSGPSGADAATILLGNPFHAAWGDSVRLLYERLHIDVIESSAWIPISAIALALTAIGFRNGKCRLTPWVLAGVVFAIWALGPWLMLSGRQSPLILPEILLRFVPIVSNARIPGRAMVVVYVVIAILAAIGFERLTTSGRAAQRGAWGLLLMLMIECIPGRPPVYVPDMPSSYGALRDPTRAGAVCELPVGLRDGFGEVGSLDGAVLLHQLSHQRPIVGGFIARLPPALARSYDTMPVVRSFLRLSSRGQVATEDRILTPSEAAATLASAGIAYVVLDLRRASPELIHYVQSGITLRRLAEEDGRVFYEVAPR